jgi:hypothetical protein
LAPSFGPAEQPDASTTQNPRADLARHLAESVARLLAAGDVVAARIANETLTKLLGDVEPEASRGVVDLTEERERRRRDGGGPKG